jgi:hypothetical protein
MTVGGKQVPVRPGTVHDLRHTCARELVADGEPRRVVQVLLGRASFASTERCSHLAPTTLGEHAALPRCGWTSESVGVAVGRCGPGRTNAPGMLLEKTDWTKGRS